MSDVTVILTTYRRPALLGPQVEAIREQTARPAWIWLWANASEEIVSREVAALGFDRIVWCTPNAFVHARFALALLAPTQFVALFDDDTLPGSRWLENCLTSFSQAPGIYGTAGMRLGELGY